MRRAEGRGAVPRQTRHTCHTRRSLLRLGSVCCRQDSHELARERCFRPRRRPRRKVAIFACTRGSKFVLCAERRGAVSRSSHGGLLHHWRVLCRQDAHELARKGRLGPRQWARAYAAPQTPAARPKVVRGAQRRGAVALVPFAFAEQYAVEVLRKRARGSTVLVPAIGSFCALCPCKRGWVVPRFAQNVLESQHEFCLRWREPLGGLGLGPVHVDFAKYTRHAVAAKHVPRPDRRGAVRGSADDRVELLAEFVELPPKRIVWRAIPGDRAAVLCPANLGAPNRARIVLTTLCHLAQARGKRVFRLLVDAAAAPARPSRRHNVALTPERRRAVGRVLQQRIELAPKELRRVILFRSPLSRFAQHAFHLFARCSLLRFVAPPSPAPGAALDFGKQLRRARLGIAHESFEQFLVGALAAPLGGSSQRPRLAEPRLKVEFFGRGRFKVGRPPWRWSPRPFLLFDDISPGLLDPVKLQLARVFKLVERGVGEPEHVLEAALGLADGEREFRVGRLRAQKQRVVVRLLKLHCDLSHVGDKLPAQIIVQL